MWFSRFWNPNEIKTIICIWSEIVLFVWAEMSLDRFLKSFCTWPRFPGMWDSELVNKWEVIFFFFSVRGGNTLRYPDGIWLRHQIIRSWLHELWFQWGKFLSFTCPGIRTRNRWSRDDIQQNLWIVIVMGEVHYGQMDYNCSSCIFEITKMCNIKCLSLFSTMSGYL